MIDDLLSAIELIEYELLYIEDDTMREELKEKLDYLNEQLEYEKEAKGLTYIEAAMRYNGLKRSDFI